MLRNKFFYILISFFFSILISYFQRITGPTYPIKGNVKINNSVVRFKFLKSCTLGDNCEIFFEGKIEGYVLYKKYRVDENYRKLDFVWDGKKSYVNLKLNLPKAAKIEYDVFIKNYYDYIKVNNKPVVIRFKGYVPPYFLIPHIIFMYLFFLLSTYLFLKLNFINEFSKKIFYFSFTSFILGGFVFGPIVQYYAFDCFWSGFPYGYDLTDNKTLLTLILWFLPIYFIIKNKPIKKYYNIAYLSLILMYLIPHSLYGSEYKFK